jgi:thiol:disulfide interchange protein DsbD
MRRFLLPALLSLLLSLPAFAQFGGPRDFDAVVSKLEARFEPATARRGETVTWKMTIDIAPGWHTYPTQQPEAAASSYVNKITAPKSGDVVFVGSVVEPPNPVKKPVKEEGIKELHYYEGSAVWEYKAVVSPNATPGEKTITVPVTVLVCDDSGCLPPKKRSLSAKLTVSDAPPVPVDPKYQGAVLGASAPPTPPPAAPPSPGEGPSGNDSSAAGTAPSGTAADYERQLNALAEQTVVGDRGVTPTNTGLGAFLLTAALWGLVSLVTPCVFPMIPITVSYFLKQSEKQHVNPLVQALVYCGTIIVVLGVAALTLLEVFRRLSVNPWTNIAMGVLFVVLALSLFGMFELTLPSSLTRFTSAREGKGGLVGTVFMALTFTIVSFTCVAPFLGGFAGIAASGQFRGYEMLLGALAFSTAFAAPFFLLALFPSALRKLPRSGGWLNSVKVVMGFLELAAALKFFRTAELRLLPTPELFTYDFVLGLWVAMALVCGLYLLNLFRLGHDEELESIGAPRMLWGFAFLGLAFYMLPGIFKNGTTGEPQRPAGTVYAWIDAFLLPEPSHNDGELRWTADLQRAVAQARDERAKTGQPRYVFVDFTGVTCTNCKYNERTVFTRPEVRKLFEPYRLVQMYTDQVPAEFYARKPSDQQREAEAAANLAFQKRKFGTEQLPLYVILEPLPDGKIAVVDVYSEGKINKVDQFVDFLKKPLAGDTSRAAR